MFEKLVQKFSVNKQNNGVTRHSTNPFMRRLSKTALGLYEKQCDIKRFSQMVMEDLDDLSGIDTLLETGLILDPFEDDKLAHLADNSQFLRDLGLTEG